MIKRLIQSISIILMILLMILIFVFSSRDAVESTEDSNRVGMTIGRIVVEDFEELPEEEQKAFAQSIDHPVRKAAHAIEFGLLGVFAFGAIVPKNTKKKSSLIALAIALVYAISDEVHQYFVPGRACLVTDIMNDTLAALVGILLVIGMMTLVEHFHRDLR